MKKFFLSHIIGQSFLDWIGAMCIFLSAGTGAGKTFAILNVLLPYVIQQGKKMLILVPRITLKEKYLADLFEYKILQGWTDISQYVVVKTYQELEQVLLLNISIEQYDYLVMDEAHYFLSDASFNVNTQLSFDYVTKNKHCVAKIFISATGERIFRRVKSNLGMTEDHGVYIDGENYRFPESFKPKEKLMWAYRSFQEFKMPPDYSYVRVRYLPKEFDITDIVRQDVNGTWAIFCGSIECGKAYHLALLEAGFDSAFLCSENLHENEEIVKTIASFERFTQKILVTTAVIETGVNFKDRHLNNLVIFADTKEQFLQMLGRKRVGQSDECLNLYVPQHDQQYFEHRYEQSMWELQRIQTVTNCIESYEDITKFLLDYPDYSAIVQRLLIRQTGKPVCNHLLLDELYYRAQSYKRIAEAFDSDDNAFLREQCAWLGLEFSVAEECFVSNNIRETYLRGIDQKVQNLIRESPLMDMEDAKKFLNSLLSDAACVDLTYARVRVFSQNAFNEFCEKHELPYSCESIRESKGTKYRFYNNKNGIEDKSAEGV